MTIMDSLVLIELPVSVHVNVMRMELADHDELAWGGARLLL